MLLGYSLFRYLAAHCIAAERTEGTRSLVAMDASSIPIKFMVLGEGLEPSRLTAPEPKSGVSANFTTRAKGKLEVKSLFDLTVNSVGW